MPCTESGGSPPGGWWPPVDGLIPAATGIVRARARQGTRHVFSRAAFPAPPKCFTPCREPLLGIPARCNPLRGLTFGPARNGAKHAGACLQKTEYTLQGFSRGCRSKTPLRSPCQEHISQIRTLEMHRFPRTPKRRITPCRDFCAVALRRFPRGSPANSPLRSPCQEPVSPTAPPACKNK